MLGMHQVQLCARQAVQLVLGVQSERRDHKAG